MPIPRQDDWEVYDDPDGRGPVVARKRRPWAVPIPRFLGWEDDWWEEDDELDEAA